LIRYLKENALSTSAKDKYELRIEMEANQLLWGEKKTVCKLLPGKSTILLPEETLLPP